MQALVDERGTILSVADVLGTVNELGLDAVQVNSLLNLDPDVVRESADAGQISFFMGLAESYFESAGIDRNLPDVGAVLDRVAAELGRELSQVEIVGADAGAVAAGVSLSLATEWQPELLDVAELPDIAIASVAPSSVRDRTRGSVLPETSSASPRIGDHR